jgi:hypothetical protein
MTRTRYMFDYVLMLGIPVPIIEEVEQRRGKTR